MVNAWLNQMGFWHVEIRDDGYAGGGCDRDISKAITNALIPYLNYLKEKQWPASRS